MARRPSPPSSKQSDWIVKIAAELSDDSITIPDTARAASVLLDSLFARANVKRTADRDAARAAANASLPAFLPEEEFVMASFSGQAAKTKQTLTGSFVYVRVQESAHGPQVKGLFVEDVTGRKVWSTVPRAIVDLLGWNRDDDYSDLLGLPIALTATFVPKPSEPGFAFANRPSGKILDVPEWSALAEARREEAIRGWEAEQEYIEAQRVRPLLPAPCCHHGASQHSARSGCWATVQIMSDVWDTCSCANPAIVWHVAPRPTEGSEVEAWFRWFLVVVTGQR